MILLKDINLRVKEIRNKFQLSQEDFGNKLGLSKSSISNIENGTRNVTKKHIKLICTIFNINELWLTTGLDNTEKLKNTEHKIANFQHFINYLKSLGYFIDIEKTSKSQNNSDEDSFSISINKGKIKAIFTDIEFNDIQKNIEQFLEYELFKHSSN